MSKQIGIEIKKIREEKGLTQENISSDIVTQAAISKIENGMYVPSLQVLESISLKLGIGSSYFSRFLSYDNPQYVDESYRYLEYCFINEMYLEVLEMTNSELGNFLLTNTRYFHYLKIHNIFSEYKCSSIDKTDAENRLLKLVESQQLTNFFISKDLLIFSYYRFRKKSSQQILSIIFNCLLIFLLLTLITR